MGARAPRVSVLLPVRDAAATLDACLDSIAAQTLTDHEVVVVDDGSRDDSAALLRAAAARDPRLRLLQPGPVGLVTALNTGLRACRAETVVRMDADDIMHRDRLAAQFAGLQRWPDCTVLGSRISLFPPAAVSEGMRRYIEWQNACLTPTRLAADIYIESPLTHPSVALRRDRVLAAGGYRDGEFPEDYELWLRLDAGGHRLRKLGAYLLRWRVSPHSLSRRDGRYARGAFDRLRAGYLIRDARLSAAAALVVWGAGRRTRQRVAVLQREGARVAAWIDIDPHKLGQRIHGAPVHPPVWLRHRAPRPLVLVYVASHGAREAVEAYLLAIGYRRGLDFISVG